MTKPVTIHVAGDAYTALFYLQDVGAFLEGVRGAHAHALPVGAEYIHQAIGAICHPQGVAGDKSPANPRLTCSAGRTPFSHLEDLLAWYEVNTAGEMPAGDNSTENLPLLRLSQAETRRLVTAGFHCDPNARGNFGSKEPDVLVHWLGELAGEDRKGKDPKAPSGPGGAPGSPFEQACKVHVQVGLREPLQLGSNQNQTGPKAVWSHAAAFLPHRLARPGLGRVLVVNIGEISDNHRVRSSSSYEAVAVDVLRLLRGDGEEPVFNQNALRQFSISPGGADSKVPPVPWTFLVVRINNSAVFVYILKREEDPTKPIAEEAWLVCHKKECAPLTRPELEPMAGHTGFVSAQLAAAIASFLAENGARKAADFERARDAVLDGASRSLIWQRMSYERGCLHLFFERDGTKKWRPRRRTAGKEYAGMLSEIVRGLNVGRTKSARSGFKGRLTQFDSKKTPVLRIKVQIRRAVAYRTQWFMARSVMADSGPDIGDKKLEKRFFDLALSWLCATRNKPGIQQPEDSGIPIVTIGRSELTDRREVEDFLAIHQALGVYAQARDARPLNIAVFGGPGSGKSTAVREVVNHIGVANKGVFQKQPLTFNLSQFRNVDDLPAALHLVRNECLSGEIPIVFFDEFDCSLDGEPFGWLKYFLAPMQDGEFYHLGHNYKIGPAVFAFAGGVNRSFEELNGRVRNPGFCEAKGPDFISRLKAHLNVQGINKPEDEADQSRYILRRGILLRSLVRRRLALQAEETGRELLHENVAKALLEVERFKHGVRSLEAIIKMCSTRPGHRIGPSDLPSMDQLEMHVDASKLLRSVDRIPPKSKAG